jgi:ribosomal protein S18 acetylase RimI-like enzyme
MVPQVGTMHVDLMSEDRTGTGVRISGTGPTSPTFISGAMTARTARTHHLYLIQHDDPHLRELIAFRDRLRTDGSARERYAELKHVLAQEYRTERDAYTAAKTSFVVKLLRQAGIEPEPRPNVAVGDRIQVLPAARDIGHDAAVRRQLALATGGGQDRVDEAVRRYRDDPNAQLLVAMLANETVGLAGYTVATDAAEVELLHVATASHVRRSGVGRRLLAEVRRAAPSGLPVVAETDDAAVLFYSAVGFTVTSLGEKYPGVQRYRVKLGGPEGPDNREWI